MTTNEDILRKLINWFEDSEFENIVSRDESIMDRDYYDGKQWTESEREVLQKRNQPCITVNRLRNKVQFLMGAEQRARTDITALPRTPKHEADSYSITDALRFVADKNNFKTIKSRCFKDALVEGTCVGKTQVKAIKEGNKVVDFDIIIKRIPYDRFYWDFRSREEDFSDAKYIGEVMWMDEEEALDLFPGKGEIFEANISEHSGISNIFEDKPDIIWVDEKRKRTRVVECWYRKGQQIWTAIFTKRGFLQNPKRSPFKDDRGQDIWPYIPMSTEVTQEGERYGFIRPLRDIQDEINHRRSKALHLLSVRQIRISRATDEDVSEVRRQLARPDGVIVADEGDIEVLPTSDMTTGQLALMQESKDEIELQGIQGALQGPARSHVSGVALQANQSANLTSLGPLFEKIRQFELEVHKRLWYMIRDFWTEEKWFRVTDDPTTSRFVGLNIPVTTKARLAQAGDARAELITPELDEVEGIQNDVSKMEVDITLIDVDDSTTAQQEQFQAWAQLASSGVVPVPPELLVELSNLRNKDQVLEAMQAQQQQQAQVQQAQLEQTQQLETANAGADIQKKLAAAERDRAEAQGKAIENALTLSGQTPE